MSQAKRVDCPFEEMRHKISATLIGVGVPEADAALLTDTFIDAEVTGVESHGIIRSKAYVDRILRGSMDPTGAIEMDIRGNVVHVNANNGFGQIASVRAIEKCVELAKEHGVAVAGIYNSNHFGAAAYYSNLIAEKGCFGFAVSDCAPAVAPFGGKKPVLGTNPIGISFPARDQTFCIDMSTSNVAKGKIRIYGRKGLKIPFGWAVDKEGNDTDDPWAALDGGSLLPIGGHKGFGLGLVVDALSGLLTGAGLSYQTTSLIKPDGLSNYGHFIAVIDIEHFLPLEAFKNRAQDWFDMIKGMEARPGMKIMIPGEPEDMARANAKQLNLMASTMDIINEYYEKYGKKD